MEMNFEEDKGQELKMKNAAYGYKYYKNPYLESEEYKRELARIEGLKLPTVGSIKLPKVELKKMQNEVAKFYMDKFKGLDFSVSSVSEKGHQELCEQFVFLANMFSADPSKLAASALDLVKSKIKKTSIFNLPVALFPNEVSMEGIIRKSLPLIGLDEYLKSLPIIDVNIVLGGKLDRLSHGTYAHEIAHGLQERHKGVIENYYYGETLSIFMEKLAIDNFDRSPNKKVLKASEVSRLSHLQSVSGKLADTDIDIEKRGEYMKYIVSGLTAGVMFDKYQSLDDQGKRRMLLNVKSVFAGKKTVEQLIEDEQISLDGGNLTRYVDKVEGYSKELESERVK